MKFQKFVDRLRRKFSALFFELLRMQLILKKVITEDEWNDIRYAMTVDFRRDNHFSELKNNEILMERVNTLNAIQPFIGKFYSEMWVRRNILKQTDEEIEIMNAEIEEEGSDQALEDQQQAEMDAMAAGGDAQGEQMQ